MPLVRRETATAVPEAEGREQKSGVYAQAYQRYPFAHRCCAAETGGPQSVQRFVGRKPERVYHIYLVHFATRCTRPRPHVVQAAEITSPRGPSINRAATEHGWIRRYRLARTYVSSWCRQSTWLAHVCIQLEPQYQRESAEERCCACDGVICWW